MNRLIRLVQSNGEQGQFQLSGQGRCRHALARPGRPGQQNAVHRGEAETLQQRTLLLFVQHAIQRGTQSGVQGHVVELSVRIASSQETGQLTAGLHHRGSGTLGVRLPLPLLGGLDQLTQLYRELSLPLAADFATTCRATL
ncbi:hypothetical protein [Streptomyces cyaneofuscatus]|uniref:hypothetical protein n=1 Tax=Streptomyces cyaneofuscatus TaxID=66883 RepID=UPI003650681A